MLKIYMLGIFLSLVSSVLIAASAADDQVNERIERQKEMDEQLASRLQELMKCKSLPGPPNGNVYCNLQFRGLDMDFAGANAPGGGTIYVNSLGKNQTLHAVGRRCLAIEFKDRDLHSEGFTMGAGILFRDDATVTYNITNKKARKECG
jgi:hypothetical protein